MTMVGPQCVCCRRAVCDGVCGAGRHDSDVSQFPLTSRLLCSPSVYFLRMWVVC
uniref:Uncharacterized protein n=1 Tax=Siphoviridae sp. ctio73 TaxID=2826435 RepID=A0A8S5MYG1_9CAUD|nr:MAG TPA: hypothetical protein [Siphoviridae sp. ctio73]